MTTKPSTRTLSDSFGTVTLPQDALWGVDTARSLQFFAIGTQRMPLEIIHAMARIKGAAARVNGQLGLLPGAKSQAIAAAAQRIAAGELDEAFPLSVWQTGSGTQSHMNVNEVIATLCKGTAHPHDEVNLGQSSNDVFPSAMHLATLQQTHGHLLPALDSLLQALKEKAVAFQGLIKTGRTHLQDATPITLGQEFGGYAAQLALCRSGIAQSLHPVQALALGGTAVGTGLNTHPEFGARVTALLAAELGLPVRQADNLFAALAGHEALVGLHASLRTLAIALNKIANDIRLMGSGPRNGLGELHLPYNEAGSSIMPGKVNPTQVEALTMVCAQVMGHDLAIGLAASQGQFELNVYKPLIALNLLDSLRLLGDAMHSFARHCVQGLQPHTGHLQQQLDRSLMLATALTPHIGYERAAAIARHAEQQNCSLRQAALDSGLLSEAQFDAWVQPQAMLGPGSLGRPGSAAD